MMGREINKKIGRIKERLVNPDIFQSQKGDDEAVVPQSVNITHTSIAEESFYSILPFPCDLISEIQ